MALAITSDPFQRLIQEFRDYFARTELVDTDVDHLKDLMNEYTSNAADWQRYAYSDPSKHYTRNYIENFSGKANLLILVWNPKLGSPVHDHARAHCVMKILQGELKEELFSMPVADSESSTPLNAMKETIYRPNEVTYVCDEIGLHRISNPSETNELAVSLHLYTPPNAAELGYHIYEENTGKRFFVGQTKTRSVI